MNAARIWYVNVFVADFNATVDFYEKQLGLPLKYKDDKFGYASFATAGAGFAVARVDPEAPKMRQLVGRHTGIGFGVPDLQRAYEELRAKGVQFTMPPTKQPWGGVLATFTDPEGNVFYLDQLREE